MSPILLEVGAIRLWYYGAAYALGFLGVHLWVSRRRHALGWTRKDTYDFSLLFVLGVLAVGRAFDVVVYEWDYYRAHLFQLLSYWRGGMASHGVLLGAVVGAALFSWIRQRSFLLVADELVIPGCVFLALGRIGNHINGEVYGFVTDVSWAVVFPYAEGARHPVALYDGLKNLSVLPILASVRRRWRTGTGMVMAHFVFWYAFLRLLVDYFRDYDSYWLGIGRGQYFNLLMALVGLGLIFWFTRRSTPASSWNADPSPPTGARMPESALLLWLEMGIFYGLVLFSLAIPSGWTQDVLELFRQRSSP